MQNDWGKLINPSIVQTAGSGKRDQKNKSTGTVERGTVPIRKNGRE